MHWSLWALLGLVAFLLCVVIYDVFQKKHTILRIFPIVGHFRYILETFGPELRQYIVTSDDEERPFSRDQRSWVYASAKGQNNYFGFGTDNELEQVDNYLIIKHSPFPLSLRAKAGEVEHDALHPVPCRKILGQARDRKKCFRPDSVVNVSGMSFGSISGRAIEAMNKGCAAADALHNTGEGGVSDYHKHGADLVWQIGTGYFGCREDDGSFSLEKFKRTVEENETIRAIEVKLSQGAKPGLGGVLPASKVTPEIARARGIPRGRDCVSPPFHSAFGDVDSMLDWIEMLADQTGLPVGIKSAVGQGEFWRELAEQMKETDRGPDYIAIDGGEGGTGAGPLTFTDHVAFPFKQAFARVYGIFCERDMADQVVWIGSGKLGLPTTAVIAFALGCDMVNVAREAMMAVGCIQAKRCHTGGCPTGVATHNPWRTRGLVPGDKAPRMKKYLVTLRYELDRVARACGVDHPSKLTLDMLEILDGNLQAHPAAEVFGYEDGWRPTRSKPAESQGD